MNIAKLHEANESVKGTHDWQKYHMPQYAKRSNGKSWFFVGCGIPYTDTVSIKTWKNEIYLVSDLGNEGSPDIRKWTVSDEVKELLNL